VRLAPELLCGMLRNHCAPYSGITVRHQADFANYRDLTIEKKELNQSQDADQCVSRKMREPLL